jgi:hypothetical protein
MKKGKEEINQLLFLRCRILMKFKDKEIFFGRDKENNIWSQIKYFNKESAKKEFNKFLKDALALHGKPLDSETKETIKQLFREN